ncbi:MAG TPA: hypothetical protein VNH11_28795 [Pirellulales bacterium]|nr:hypothetical protein [Pirellulales bacterium]
MIQAISPCTNQICDSAALGQPRMDFPSEGWTLPELYDRARWEDKEIGHCQRCCPRYWFFGKVLLLVQAQVPEGGWQDWCIENHIQRDRWHCGRLLALAFESPDDVAELTIDEAERLAREILGLPQRRSTADAKLRRWLSAMSKSLQERLDEFGEVTNVKDVRVYVAELRRKLNELDAACAALEKRHPAPVRKRRKQKP